MQRKRGSRTGVQGWLLLVPALALVLFIVLIPSAWIIYQSFTNYNLARAEVKFIGAGNYLKLLSDEELGKSLTTTFTFMAITIPSELGLGLLSAAMVHKLRRAQRTFTTVLMIPLMTAPIIAGLAVLYNFYSFGTVGQLYGLFGMFPPDFLGSQLALLVIAMTDIWQYTPFMFLVFLAGLSSLPQGPMEAAVVDGASRWQMRRLVRLPLLKSVIVIALLLRLTEVFKLFEYIKVVTGGGPLGDLTQTFTYYLYRIGFNVDYELGYVAAVSLVTLLIGSFILTRVLRRTGIFWEAT